MNSSPTETALHVDILKRQLTVEEQSSSSKAASQALPLASQMQNLESRVTNLFLDLFRITCSGVPCPLTDA